MTGLSPRQAAFVEGIVAGKTQTQAAIDAGYPNAASKGSKLVRTAKVKAAIEARRAVAVAAVEAATHLSLQRLVDEAAAIALCDPKDFYGPDGAMLTVPEMPEHARRVLMSMEVDATYQLATTGEKTSPPTQKEASATQEEGAQEPEDGPSVDILKVVTVKVKTWNKLQALELVAKLLGYLKDKKELEHSGDVLLRWARDDEDT